MVDPHIQFASSSALSPGRDDLSPDHPIRESLVPSVIDPEIDEPPPNESAPLPSSPSAASPAGEDHLLRDQLVPELSALQPSPAVQQQAPPDPSPSQPLTAPPAVAGSEPIPPADHRVPENSPFPAACLIEQDPQAIGPITTPDSGPPLHREAAQSAKIPDEVQSVMHRRRRRSARLVQITILSGIVAFCGRWTPAPLVWIPIICVPVFMYSLVRCFYVHREVRRDRRRISVMPLGIIPDNAVLYLRSFSDDRAASKLSGSLTEEEHLTKALGQIGRVVAVGRPDEFRPELGAARLYRSDEEWQTAVEKAIRNATLVVMRTGSSAGILWELDRVLRYVAPQKLLLIVDDLAEMKLFLSTIRKAYPHVHPSVKLRGPKIGSVRGFLQFDDTWQVSSIRLRRCWFSKNQDSSMIGVRFRCSLKPLFQRLGLPWKGPRIDWIKVYLKMPLILFVAAAVVEAFLLLLWGVFKLLCRC